MTNRPEAIEVARRWMRKAEHDWINAEHTMLLGDACPFDTVCFHAQQCAEKYLKALLVMHLVHFPKVHDLEELVKNLPAGISAGASPEELRLLSVMGIEGRYPDAGEEPGRPEAERAVAIAERVRQEIRRQMPREVVEGV